METERRGKNHQQMDKENKMGWCEKGLKGHCLLHNLQTLNIPSFSSFGRVLC